MCTKAPCTPNLAALLYVGLGAAFGVSPEMALGVSLLRRACDLALGVTILLAFQPIGLRRLR